MIVEFEENFSHQEHNNLVFGHMVEQAKIVVDNDEKSTHYLVVISFKNYSNHFEEIVMIECYWNLHCLFLSYHL